MKFPRLFLTIFFSLIVYLVVSQYFFCAQFSFEATKPFSGPQFYNPYQSADKNDWVKCNFHAHSHAWRGLTNGHGNASDIYHVYDSMHYGVHCISDYQKINESFSNTNGYIPAYEHGYGIKKTHQLVLGNHHVCWLDYLFPQTLSNKQNILDCLKDSDDVVIINHPTLRNGYDVSDFKYLANYSFIEALNPKSISLNCWDSALSSGKKVFIIGDDDVHNIFEKNCLAKMCTCVNTPTLTEKSVLNTLKKGCEYGMILGNDQDNLPHLNQLQVNHDTLSLEMSQKAKSITFIGQNEQTLATNYNSTSAQYIIQPKDHYVRTEIVFDSGTEIFLNPVFRYSQNQTTQSLVYFNRGKTALFRLAGIIICLIWLKFAIRFCVPQSARWKIKNQFGYFDDDELIPSTQAI